ncbi:hypothetical protein QBC46DRAFT_432874 [Diplogelasinospora grovesii]|uniref:Uncharacterized protein n=1 Tax=Diplogelasinospora grovesii TaxID=303347 RepID=A0AAN6N906_9PEZI|nr:hypothetical protein QBC46DRAFT_432874 [Diplogelasinospora grovesii]
MSFVGWISAIITTAVSISNGKDGGGGEMMHLDLDMFVGSLAFPAMLILLCVVEKSSRPFLLPGFTPSWQPDPRVQFSNVDECYEPKSVSRRPSVSVAARDYEGSPTVAVREVPAGPRPMLTKTLTANSAMTVGGETVVPSVPNTPATPYFKSATAEPEPSAPATPALPTPTLPAPTTATPAPVPVPTPGQQVPGSYPTEPPAAALPAIQVPQRDWRRDWVKLANETGYTSTMSSATGSGCSDVHRPGAPYTNWAPPQLQPQVPPTVAMQASRAPPTMQTGLATSASGHRRRSSIHGGGGGGHASLTAYYIPHEARRSMRSATDPNTRTGSGSARHSSGRAYVLRKTPPLSPTSPTVVPVTPHTPHVPARAEGQRRDDLEGRANVVSGGAGEGTNRDGGETKGEEVERKEDKGKGKEVKIPGAYVEDEPESPA